jgi:fucose permease
VAGEPPGIQPPLIALAWSSFALIGWTGLLMPTLIRSIEERFSESDAGIGAFYFVTAIFYAAGSLAGGLLTERVGRGLVLPGAAILIGAGLAFQAIAPSWPLFVGAGALVGVGSGAIDGGMNGLILAVSPRRPAGAMNALHLFFSVGALTSPFVVGRLVVSGVPWQVVLGGTAAVAGLIGLLFGGRPMPSGRRAVPGFAASTTGGEARTPGRDASSALPLIALAVSIATYVASEIGVSSWLVRYLASSTVETATAALAIFWGGLTIGRLLSIRIADRLPPVFFAGACSTAAAVALAAAVLVPDPTVAVALFGVLGLAYGPVYPLIMTLAGALYPRRLAAVTGTLGASAVVGSIVYPPLIGLLSEGVGIGAAFLGGAGLSVVCAVALAGAWLAARGARHAVEP